MSHKVKFKRVSDIYTLRASDSSGQLGSKTRHSCFTPGHDAHTKFSAFWLKVFMKYYRKVVFPPFLETCDLWGPVQSPVTLQTPCSVANLATFSIDLATLQILLATFSGVLLEIDMKESVTLQLLFSTSSRCCLEPLPRPKAHTGSQAHSCLVQQSQLQTEQR